MSALVRRLESVRVDGPTHLLEHFGARINEGWIMWRLILVGLVSLLPVAASAATASWAHLVTYRLEGSALTGCHVGGVNFAIDRCPDEYTQGMPWIGAFDGTITIDERRLDNRSLVSTRILLDLPSTHWEYRNGEYVPVSNPGNWQAITSADLGFLPLLSSCCGGWLMIETDERRRPTDWWITVLDGPPDYGVSRDGPAYLDGSGIVWTGPSGVLRLDGVAPIPVPPAAALLLGGLALLGAIGRRRARNV